MALIDEVIKANDALQKDANAATSTKNFGQATTNWLKAHDVVTPPPTTPPPTTSTVPRYGISVGGKSIYRSAADMKFELDQIAAIGAKVVRVDCAKGSEAKVDVWVDEVTKRGMQSLLILGGWLSAPMDQTQWRTFVAACRDRYTAKGVRLFENSNEPNIRSWTGAQYAQSTIIAYEEIKKANNVIMATGALSLPATSILSFATAMFAAGVGGHFDAFSVHAYNDAAGHGAWSAWDVTFGHPTYYPGDNNIAGLMRKNGGAKPVWITECGDNSDSQGLTYQANAVRDAITDPRPQLSTVYTMLNDDVHGFGLLNDDKSKKPSWDAFRQAAV